MYVCMCTYLHILMGGQYLMLFTPNTYDTVHMQILEFARKGMHSKYTKDLSNELDFIQVEEYERKCCFTIIKLFYKDDILLFIYYI